VIPIPKGGARKVSAKKAIAKGMGISTFFEVLAAISKHSEGTTVDVVMEELYHLFGGTRNETCRSYFKELWRYGFVDKLKNERTIECTSKNWSRGGKAKYKINDNGQRLLLLPHSLCSFALAWLLVQLDDSESFEQLHRTFNVLKEKNLPLGYFKASKITGVVRDSIKAIMYGWLEPLGFLERVNSGKEFKLNQL